ncbi:MAG TPA: methyltransferase domain-containing protein [Verrucomicrobiota bacterium]|nr:methyltransferase domain-containing protein [Verrucomicrobiota bacterium]
MAFSIHNIYRHIFRVWRVKRFDQFLRILKPAGNERLLDVGGYPGYWLGHAPVVGQVDCLNVHEVKYDPARFPTHNIRVLLGDGCALDVADASYDIAFSNSVIEHVGSWENQVKFARELRRVGRRMWCQTPARGCPIEPHYLAPFVHWLPKGVQRRILRWLTPWGLISRPSQREVDEMVETTRLLSKKEMLELFPDCEIRVEYLLPFIPKSYVAIRTAPSARFPAKG